MQPTIRLTDYVAEYQKLVYDDYSEWNNTILATYYKLDAENTVYDENYIDTYRITGDKSGRKWKKIHLLPIGYIQQVMPSLSSSEYGVNFSQDTETAVTIDSSVKLKPKPGDLLHFQIDGDYVYWQITNIERSGPLEKAFFRCTVEQIRPRTNWEDYNIQGEYIYIEYLKDILPLVQGYNFVKLLNRLESLITFLNKDLFHKNICVHINNNKNSFPEMDFILNSYNTIIPPNMTLISEKYVNELSDTSVLNLLFLPNLFQPTFEINYMFKRTYNNPRIKLFKDFKEYVSDLEGDLDIIEDFYPNDYTKVKEVIELFKESLFNTNTDISLYPEIAITNLLQEFLDFLKMGNPAEEMSEELSSHISTNLLEAVLEFCLVSRKISVLSEIEIYL